MIIRGNPANLDRPPMPVVQGGKSTNVTRDE